MRKLTPRVRTFVRYLTLAFLMVWPTVVVVGQSQSETPINQIGWYVFESKNLFVKDKPWGVFLASEAMRDGMLVDKLDVETRIGLVYNLLSRYEIMGGYVYKYNYPYDAASQQYNWPEHRVWEQIQWNYIWGDNRRYTLTPRIRIEQRWLQRKAGPNLDQISWEFEDTLRAQLRFDRVLNETVSLRFYNEFYLRAPPPEGQKVIDSNSAFVGFLVHLDAEGRWKMEVGYLNRSYWFSPETQEGRKRINHTLRLAVYFTAPFRSH